MTSPVDHPADYERIVYPPGLSRLGQALYAERELAGIGNYQCPYCEDEDSFGPPCEKCIELHEDEEVCTC
jgi:hypothetical protein